MAKNVDFSGDAWEDYIYWQAQDKKTIKRINQLIKDIERNGYEGIGHPEPLSGNLAGYWSRRIDDTNRFIYRLNGEIIEIYGLRTHYGDN
jgi:toxin YoeB